MVNNSSANPAEVFSASTFLSPLVLGESGESGLRQKYGGMSPEMVKQFFF